MPGTRDMRAGLLVITIALACGARGAGAMGEPGAYPSKPERTVLDGRFEAGVISVKFRDGLVVRLRDGALTDLGTGALGGAPAVLDRCAAGTWHREHSIPEEELERLRTNAAANLGRPVSDLNLYFRLVLPRGMEAAGTIDAFNALACVEMAQGVPVPPPPPTPPNFQPQQGYLNAPSIGIGAVPTWALRAGSGFGVRIVDIEFGWNFGHDDLPPVTHLGKAGVPLFEDHGTAVLGMLVGLDNGWGVTGIAHASEPYAASAHTAAGWNVGAAITATLPTLRAGDVILLEQQIYGPNQWFSPVEWFQPWYAAVVAAVGNGVVVVEAAGNGSADLDHPSYSTGNGGHWPFLPANDSGAIMVGAGAAPASFGGTTVDRSRLALSNYGARLDVQGWGEAVATAGYGDLYSVEGPDLVYTATFSGTSSGSAIVAGACAIVQAVHKAATGRPLSPARLRTVLRATGSPQQSGQFPATQNVGPRPNAMAAIDSLGLCFPDCTNDGALTVSDFGCFQTRYAAGQTYADCDLNGQLSVADFGCFQTLFVAGCR